MISVFYVKQQRFDEPEKKYAYLYFFDMFNGIIDILNPWTRDLKRTTNKIVTELYYKDQKLMRVHRELFIWEP